MIPTKGARSAVKTLIKDGLVLKIRANLYTCVSGETGRTSCQSISNSETGLLHLHIYLIIRRWNIME